MTIETKTIELSNRYRLVTSGRG